MAVIGEAEAQRRRLRETQYQQQFGGGQAPKPPRVVPPVDGVRRGAGPAPATREGRVAVPSKAAPVPVAGDKPVPIAGDKPLSVAAPVPQNRDAPALDFRPALTALTTAISRDDVAIRLGVSYDTIKQAALPPEAPKHRSPPKGWRVVMLLMAEEMAEHYRRLADEMRG